MRLDGRRHVVLRSRAKIFILKSLAEDRCSSRFNPLSESIDVHVLQNRRKFQLLRGMFIRKRMEMRAATSLIESSRTYNDQLLALPKSLRMYRRRSADHAHRRQLRHRIRNSHQVRDRPKRLSSERRVEPGHDHAFSQSNELNGQWNYGRVEELDLVNAHNFNRIYLRVESFPQVFDIRHRSRLMRLRAVAGDGGAVITEVNVWFKAGDALPSNAGALESANQFLALSRKHRAGDYFEDAGNI